MTFLTRLKAIDPSDGKLKTWGGPRIEASSMEDAKDKIKDKGYLELDGWLIQELEFRLSKDVVK
jgi:hypothetical protein